MSFQSHHPVDDYVMTIIIIWGCTRMMLDQEGIMRYPDILVPYSITRAKFRIVLCIRSFKIILTFGRNPFTVTTSG